MNIIFNKQNFEKFIIERFDPVAYKYGRRIQDSNECEFELADSDRNNVLSYERAKSPTNIEPHDVASMIMNTKLVYGSLEKAYSFQYLYEVVSEKIIVNYIGIPGLSALYDEDYPDFEWSMHINLNFQEHRNSYYRDHFIHEMRNVYMMYSLLNDKFIYNNVVKYLYNPSVGKLSQYICSELNKWHFEYDTYPAPVKNLISENFCSEEYFLPTASPRDCYFLRYIVYASSAIAGLFHDIGYPISHNYETQDRAIDFFPPLNILLSNEGINFDQIQDLLSDTLLFQIVESKEIKERFEHREHGVLSALLLALHYHKTGRIHALPIEQQVALEVGIVIIYNHTLDFFYSKKEGCKLHYKMQFARDPLSWLFRLCDDAQEWEREYFQITNTPNLIFCEKCHTPLLKSFEETDYQTNSDAIIRKYLQINPLDPKDETSTAECVEHSMVSHEEKECDTATNICTQDISSDSIKHQMIDTQLANGIDSNKNPDHIFSNPVKMVRYKCQCEQSYIHNRLSWFERRQIVTIQTCEYVKVTDVNKSNDTAQLLIDFYYNPYKQLRLCSIHHTFSQYRARDLANDKRFLQMQDFIDDFGCGYDRIALKHNLTPNPYLLKAIIWGEYLKTDRLSKNNATPLEQVIEKIVDQLYEVSGASRPNYVTNIIANAIFYATLYEYWQGTKSTARQDAINQANIACNNFLKGYKSITVDYNVRYFNDLLEKFAQNQIVNTVDPTTQKDLYSENYEKYLLEGKEVYATVARYCNREEIINQVPTEKYYRDYYSDLFLYEQLSLFTKMGISIT